jgi:hypothetical protein
MNNKQTLLTDLRTVFDTWASLLSTKAEQEIQVGDHVADRPCVGTRARDASGALPVGVVAARVRSGAKPFKTMRRQASVRNAVNDHQAVVSTGGQARRIEIPAKTAGQGSSVNEGSFSCWPSRPATATTSTAKRRTIDRRPRC